MAILYTTKEYLPEPKIQRNWPVGCFVLLNKPYLPGSEQLRKLYTNCSDEQNTHNLDQATQSIIIKSYFKQILKENWSVLSKTTVLTGLFKCTQLAR